MVAASTKGKQSKRDVPRGRTAVGTATNRGGVADSFDETVAVGCATAWGPEEEAAAATVKACINKVWRSSVDNVTVWPGEGRVRGTEVEDEEV